uniref:nicotinamidase n=1 Tax=Crassostrea virginica TaxID=6565 RepID=A0A8B8CYI0_CRAVI|nr:uncharacterized protein LOC111123069 isoform X2 [Crassostrea virginica]
MKLPYRQNLGQTSLFANTGMFTLQRCFGVLFIITSLQVISGRIALLVIDVQNCFLPTGSLPVNDGDQVIPVINGIRQQYDNLFSLVVFSQDWHCSDHISFASQHDGKNSYSTTILQYDNTGKLCESTCDVQYNLTQVLWPDHCIKNTTDAEFAVNVTRSNTDVIVKKGYHCKIDSYSAFFDNGGFSQTELDVKLKEKDIKSVIITGLALDYCVFYTAKDAKRLGYNVYVVQDATRGVEEGTTVSAVREMKDQGINIVQSSEMSRVMQQLTSAGILLRYSVYPWYISVIGITHILLYH